MMNNNNRDVLLKIAEAIQNTTTIEQAVDNWLEDHPEATTTVQDGSITKAKLNAELKASVDDVSNLKSALNNNFLYLRTFATEDGKIALQNGGLDIDTGAAVTNSKKRRSDFIIADRKVIRVVVGSDYLAAPFFYSTEGNDTTYHGFIAYKESDSIFVTNYTYNRLRLEFKRKDGANMSSSDSTAIKNSLKLLYDTDETLTIPYAFADAKAVGDRFAEMFPLRGKKYAALGDSITYGYIPRNYTGYPGQLNSFAKLTAERLGMEFANYGIIGSSMAYISDRDPMSRRFDDLPDDADLITVMGGTNDIRNGILLGTMSDRTDETYYGALHVVLGGLYKKYMIDQGTTIGKKKHIVVLTPIKLLDESAAEQGGTGTLVDFDSWIAAVKEVAAYYSMPCLDFYNLSGINPHLNETIQGTETGYTGYYNPYITDGTHPTQEGAEIMADVLCGFLKTIV